MSGTRRATALRWTVYIALAIVFAIVCVYLSRWQFDRNQQRATDLALVAANYDAAPVPLNDLLPADSLDPADTWHPVVVTGEYDADAQLLVRNRAHGGTNTFEVLVPLHTADGRIFIVNRGWVLPGNDSPLPDEVPAAPAGEVTVVARLQPGEPLPPGRTAPEGQVPTINLPLVAQTTGEGTITAAYGLLVSEDPAPATRPAEPEPPSDDPGPHLSYAIQWILFAVMGFIFIGYIIRTEIAHRREDAAAADAEPDPIDPSQPGAPARHPRRAPRASAPRPRDRDAQDEDRILDAQSR